MRQITFFASIVARGTPGRSKIWEMSYGVGFRLDTEIICIGPAPQ